MLAVISPEPHTLSEMSILSGSVGGREQRQVTKALTCTVGKGAIRRKSKWDSVGRDV